MTTPDLPKTPLPTITVVPDGPNLIVVGTDQIAQAARHLDGIEGWNSSHPGEYEGLPCVRFLGARPATATPAPWPFEPGVSVPEQATGGPVPDCCDHTDMEQGRCHACHDTGHAHDPATPCPPAIHVQVGQDGIAPAFTTPAGPGSTVDVEFLDVPTTTLHACTVDETAGGAETTGAVKRGAEQVLDQPTVLDDDDARIIARAVLTAALDVDEMARTLGEHEAQMLLPDGVAPDDYDGRDHWMCSCDHDYGVYDVGADADPAIRAHEAHVLRAALLGGEGA